MKGNISIKDFVKKVKDEILQSIDDENPLFELEKIDLEITFQLEGSANAGFNLVVFDAETKATATQTHKVKLSLTPVLKGPDNGGAPKGYRAFGDVHQASEREKKKVAQGQGMHIGNWVIGAEKKKDASQSKGITLKATTVKVEG